MNMKWEIYIARHWETTANITKAIVWITDVQLTDKWKIDAHNIWARIWKQIDMIISSPQMRAQMTSDIIRKYGNPCVVEFPVLHPQNFWEIEWLTLDQAREKWLTNCLHTLETNKYIHKSNFWESAQEMELRVIPEIKKIINVTKTQNYNLLLLTHNSIARCLIWNIHQLPPKVWLENNIRNDEIFRLEEKELTSLNNNISFSWNQIVNILDNLFDTFDFNSALSDDFLSNFAKISLHQEKEVIDYLVEKFKNHLDNYHVVNLLKLLENTIKVNDLIQEINDICKIDGIYSVLYFGSTIYGKNYSIKDNSDLDIELIIDDKFDISQLKDNILLGYSYWDIQKDFHDFLLSWSDYFSFKSMYKWRPIDYRITKKDCFEKICQNTLKPWNEYIMKEFRKQYRENGIIACRKSFLWDHFSWNNNITYTKEGQIIHYPLYKWEQWRFVAWNNIDKYCSFTKVFKNEVEVKKQLFNLRKSFLRIYNDAKKQNNELSNLSIIDIFIRKDRFPKYLQQDLQARYDFYNLLFNK